jgi:hypothetical protein
LSEREVCFGGSTNWFGTLPAQAWEDFICPNHDPNRNRPFYLTTKEAYTRPTPYPKLTLSTRGLDWSLWNLPIYVAFRIKVGEVDLAVVFGLY